MLKFWERQVWTNSADPDQTAPRASSLCMFWMHYSKEKPSCSTFRVITANFLVSEILGLLRYDLAALSVFLLLCTAM